MSRTIVTWLWNYACTFSWLLYGKAWIGTMKVMLRGNTYTCCNAGFRILLGFDLIFITFTGKLKMPDDGRGFYIKINASKQEMDASLKAVMKLPVMAAGT